MITRLALILIAIAGITSQARASEELCAAASDMSYICDIVNAEDLVAVPESAWILASGYSTGGGVYAMDSRSRAFKQAYDSSKAEHDAIAFPECSSPPAADAFVAHGLNIRATGNGRSMLYVVGHGGREAIEVFDVESASGVPELTWVGCVMMPEGLDANSVASHSDGSLRLTVLNHHGYTFVDVFAGKKTGAVYAWSPGDTSIQKIPGSELPGNNGIELSKDGTAVYVVSTGLSTISVFSNTNPMRLLRTTARMDFSPDNIHMTPEGLIMTGGPSWIDHACDTAEGFDLEAFATCPRGSVGATFDPVTLTEVQRWSARANPAFSNATMALKVGNDVWLGTFSGTRIGIITTEEM
jgi:hypothetical protein